MNNDLDNKILFGIKKISQIEKVLYISLLTRLN
jgi:cell division protein FtsL